MAFFDKTSVAFVLCIFSWGTAFSEDDLKQLRVGEIELEINLHPGCEKPSIERYELAKNLGQYNPSEDPKSDIYDETPRTQKEVVAVKRQLVKDGFIYPNGKESVITWLDFDGDGKCDFTTTVGIGGNRSIDRMMLFRNLGNRKFQLVDSHSAYMENKVALIPYIPLLIKGERVPLIIVPMDDRILQWREGGNGFATCNATFPLRHPLRLENVDSPKLERLCTAFWAVKDWLEGKLPHRNRMSRWE